MKIHTKIAFSNTIIFTIFIVILNNITGLPDYKKFFLIITSFFILSNFISKFILINVYETLEKSEKILFFIKNKFISDLRKELFNLEECFHQVFSEIKIDILDILVKEGEIKKEKEKAENLSEKLIFLNKNLENIVEKRTKELKSANNFKNELLAKISHEMRTPLTSIIGYSKLLKKYNLDLEAKNKLQTINTSGIKLLNFVNELLDFSKIEAGTVDLNFESFNVNEFFFDIYNEHIEHAKEKNLKLEFQLPKNTIYIYSDKMKIYEIIKNLVHNAIKYTKKGAILCEVEITNSFLHFNIYDSGIGISDKNLNYIFKDFSQINRQSSGAGLGLSITKKLIEILKGEIKVKSKLNLGTTFNVRIPIEITQVSNLNLSFDLRKLMDRTNIKIKPIILKSILKFPIRLKKLKEASENRDVKEIRKLNHILLGTYGNLDINFVYEVAKNISLELKKEKINFKNILSSIDKLETIVQSLSYDEIFEEYLTLTNKKLKLLIAEDIEENRIFFKALLKLNFIEVTCVENGLLALKELQDNNFNIILLDIHMPVMGGIQALQLIKSNPKSKEIPTIALTAQALLGDKEKYLAYGFDGYIAKPISEAIFFSYLEHFM